MTNDVLTVGHSTHAIDTFLALLSRNRIDVVADVRSSPFSRFNPQFNKDALKESLRGAGIRYVFLGKELGARTDDPGCYVQDRVQFDCLARSPLFQSGLDRVMEGASKYRVALMCAEKDPLECHRTILVARHLVARDFNVAHILPDGSVETHEAAMERLLKQTALASDMFRSAAELTEEAYRRQGERIAFDRSDRDRQSQEPIPRRSPV